VTYLAPFEEYDDEAHEDASREHHLALESEASVPLVDLIIPFYIVELLVCTDDISIGVGDIVVDSINDLSLHVHNLLHLSEHPVDHPHVLVQPLDVLLSSVISPLPFVNHCVSLVVFLNLERLVALLHLF
jgi:hypothetical protein